MRIFYLLLLISAFLSFCPLPILKHQHHQGPQTPRLYMPHLIPQLNTLMIVFFVYIWNPLENFLLKLLGKHYWCTTHYLQPLNDVVFQCTVSEQEVLRSQSDEDIMSLRGRFDRVYFRKRRTTVLWFQIGFVSALFVVNILALFFFCGRLVPHRLFPSSPLL